MCPGLTSPGAKMTEVSKGAVVVWWFHQNLVVCFLMLFIFQAIMAEGKQNALAIGMTALSTDDMYVMLCFLLLHAS